MLQTSPPRNFALLAQMTEIISSWVVRYLLVRNILNSTTDVQQTSLPKQISVGLAARTGKI